MKRTFFAVDIHPDKKLLSDIQEIKASLRDEKIKWIQDNQWHLTLKFLGDTREETIGSLIHDVSLGIRKLPCMNLHLFSLGLFKNLHNPRILWIGIKPDAMLSDVAKFINEITLQYGFEAENREFSPHLTIGRIKEIRHTSILNTTIGQFKDTSFGTVRISEIIFYESILKPDGPVYIPIHKFPLGKSDSGTLDNG